MKTFATIVLTSVVLCSCSPLSYKFTEGTTSHFKTETDRLRAEKEAFNILNQ